MAQIVGELDQLIRNVRRKIGEVAAGEWQDNDIVDAANDCADRLFTKILLPANNGYGVYSANVTFVADQEYYDLPYGFVRLLEPSVRDSDGNHVYDDDVISRSDRTLYDGVWLENNQLGVSPIPATAETNARKIFYVRKPCPIHRGEAQAIAAASLTLAKTASLGRVLTRNNSYLGCKVQVLNATTNEGEIATVTAYTGTTHVATLAWANLPTGTISYEIMPDLPDEALPLWYASTALECLKNNDAGSVTKVRMLMDEVRDETNTLRFVAASRVAPRTAPDAQYLVIS